MNYNDSYFFSSIFPRFLSQFVIAFRMMNLRFYFESRYYVDTKTHIKYI